MHSSMKIISSDFSVFEWPDEYIAPVYEFCIEMYKYRSGRASPAASFVECTLYNCSFESSL